METLKTINFVIAVIFFVCYTYQFLYIPVPWLRKARPHGPAKDNRYAVLICARNEQRVIGDLIASLRGQTYSQGLLSIFVLADNCTDDTAMVARVAGANVYERFNQVQVGKGYALQELLEHLEQDYPQGFDGYFVFDADNILAPNYVEAMNRTFSDGHDIVTSYRNSKNYGDNWISAGYALWFLRESRYLNHARFLLGTSCAVSGTGFLFSRRVLEETGPWPFHLLTEDIQFSVDQVTRGRSQLRRYMTLGGGHTAPSAVTIGGVSLDDNAKTVTVDGDTVNLTPLEYDILRLLMQHPGKVFSPHEIYRRVWHEDPAADNPVAVHVRHIREKIEINPAEPRYLKVVWGKGYKMEGTAQ